MYSQYYNLVSIIFSLTQCLSPPLPHMPPFPGPLTKDTQSSVRKSYPCDLTPGIDAVPDRTSISSFIFRLQALPRIASLVKDHCCSTVFFSTIPESSSSSDRPFVLGHQMAIADSSRRPEFIIHLNQSTDSFPPQSGECCANINVFTDPRLPWFMNSRKSQTTCLSIAHLPTLNLGSR